MKVKVTTYKHEEEDLLIIETIPPFERSENFIPAGDGNIGCVLNNSQDELGISIAAYEVMKKLPKRGGSFAPLMWFDTDNGSQAFGWLGGVYAVLPSTGLYVDRDFVLGKYTEIPNEPPQGAIDSIIASADHDEESCENCTCGKQHN